MTRRRAFDRSTCAACEGVTDECAFCTEQERNQLRRENERLRTEIKRLRADVTRLRALLLDTGRSLALLNEAIDRNCKEGKGKR